MISNSLDSDLRNALASGRPFGIAGRPGCGKTTALRAVVKILGWREHTLYASALEPSDFASGVPVREGGAIAWKRILPDQPGPGLLVFDDMNGVNPQCATLLRQAARTGVIAGLPLPAGWNLAFTFSSDDAVPRVVTGTELDTLFERNIWRPSEKS